jgi:hypothetical protein
MLIAAIAPNMLLLQQILGIVVFSLNCFHLPLNYMVFSGILDLNTIGLSDKEI